MSPLRLPFQAAIIPKKLSISSTKRGIQLENHLPYRS